MIFDAMGWALRQPIKCLDKMVLLMLAYRLNSDTGVADPAIDKMATDCGLSRTAIKAALQRLQQASLLTVESRHDQAGNSLPNHYRLPWEGRGRETTEGGAPDDRGVGRETTPKAVKSFSSSSPTAKLDYSAWPSLPSDQTFADWIKLRNAKKAPVTQTIVDRFAKELQDAELIGWSAEEAIAHCVYMNWRGFEVGWLTPKEKGQPVRTALGTTPNTTRSRNDTSSRQGSNGSPRGGAIDRVLANARARQEAAADDGAGPDWFHDDGSLRP